MSFEPLLAATLPIQFHAFAAMGAFALGLVQFATPKGTLPHRTAGWVWVTLMLIVAASSFWIHEIKLWGAVESHPFSVDLHARHVAARGVRRT